MTYLTGLSKCTERTWSSVQSGVGEKDNIELNSVLVFSKCLYMRLVHRVFLINIDF